VTSSPDRYVREHLLGEGGMGRVWAARDRRLGRRVALKEPRGSSTGPASSRLRREAAVLARLDHPGIVPLLDKGRLPDGRPFVVMRLVSGDDLAHLPPVRSVAERLARARRLRDVVAAMSHAHSRGVVHRDLKPTNVRLDSDGAVQILDWGLSRVLSEEGPAAQVSAPLVEEGLLQTRAGTRLGTPAYMSPEQAAGDVVGPRSDVWSLGILLWEGLSGQRAYTGRAASAVLAGVLSGPPRPLREVVPALPVGLCAVVDGALSPREDRPADAGVLLKQLDVALRRSLVFAMPLHRKLGLALGCLAIGAGVSAVGMLLRDRPEAVPSVEEVRALVQRGEVVSAELAAARRLAHDPQDPVARGALVRTTPRPSLVWEADPPLCTIGEALRWDGRLVACASERSTRLFQIDSRGLTERWTRSDELHVLVFMGEEAILGMPPRSDWLVRLQSEDGAPRVLFSSELAGGTLVESRHPSIAVSLSGHSRRRAEIGVGLVDIRTFDNRPMRIIVLSNGSEMYLDGAHLRLTNPTGEQVVQSWSVPADQGLPAWFAVSTEERMVAVLTDIGRVSVASLDAPGWSPWADHDLQSCRQLAVSNDGRHVAAVTEGRAILWLAASPAHRVQLPPVAGTVGFPSDEELVSYGRNKVRWWRLPETSGRSAMVAGGPIRDLAWGEGGLIARHRGGARVWDTDGRLVSELPHAVAIGREIGGPRRYVVDADHAIRVFEDGQERARFDTPGCRLTDWPAGGPIVCADVDGGPYLIDPDTGVVDSRSALPHHRWHHVRATGPHVALMDWDTSIYSLVGDALVERFEVPWTTLVIPTPAGDGVLLNSRRGVRRRTFDPISEAEIGSTWARSFGVALSPNGQWVAGTRMLGGLGVWHADTGVLALDLPDGVGPVGSVAWSPDGRRLGIGEHDGSVRLLDLTPLTLPADALRSRVETAWLPRDSVQVQR